MSHKLTSLKVDNEFNHGGKGKSQMKKKAKAGVMTKAQLADFFGHKFPAMTKVKA